MTILSLVPNKANPITLSDFRSISFYNTLYKFITRILTLRIKEILPSLIVAEQYALFVEGGLLTTFCWRMS